MTPLMIHTGLDGNQNGITQRLSQSNGCL